jgi:RNA polymerase primary sigma factor
MYRVQHKLNQKLGREPKQAEIAETLGESLEKIQQLSKDAQFTLSLEMPITVEADKVLGEYIEDQDSADPFEKTTISLLRQHLNQILEMLPPREARIIKLRFGLLNGETHTLREVGLKMGVSRERIRQIEAQAIRRLRHPEIQRKLSSYVNQAHT